LRYHDQDYGSTEESAEKISEVTGGKQKTSRGSWRFLELVGMNMERVIAELLLGLEKDCRSGGS